MKNSNPEYDLSAVSWHKSTYSGPDGADCLELGTWRKSSYSDGSGGNCVEISATHPSLVPVRDSKTPDAPALAFRAAAWSAFVADLKQH